MQFVMCRMIFLKVEFVVISGQPYVPPGASPYPVQPGAYPQAPSAAYPPYPPGRPCKYLARLGAVFVTTKVWIFIVRCCASMVCVVVLRLFVRLSVTSRTFTKTAKHRITQTMLHNGAGSLVFWCQRPWWYLNRCDSQWGHQIQMGCVKIVDFQSQYL